MPAYGSVSSKSNIVNNPPALPVAMTTGKVSCNCGFETSPTGSLEYSNVAESDLPNLESAYQVGKKLTLYGIPLMVSSYSYQREGYACKDLAYFSVYTVNVSLESKYKYLVDYEIPAKLIAGLANTVSVSALAAIAGVPYSGPKFYITLPANADKDFRITLKSVVESHARIYGCYISYTNGVELKSLTTSGGWNFPVGDVINDGQNSLGYPKAFNKTELTGNFLVNSIQNLTQAPFAAKQPMVQTIEEADDDYDLPPFNSKILKTLDSCFDSSGPKKTRKITTTVDGTPDTEEIWTYGFMFTASDIAVNNNTVLISTNPATYWRIIQYEKTIHHYQSLPPVTLSVHATDPNNPTVQYPTVVKPGYEQYASVGLAGGTITFNTSAQYLTEITGIGYKWGRFDKDRDGNLITLYPSDPHYAAAQFRKIPLESRTQYLLKSTRVEYNDKIGEPFSIEWVDYNSLDPATKLLVDPYAQINASGQVALLTPDPNYVEPLYVSKETKETNSFAYMPDPQNSAYNLAVPLVTGEESYSRTDRTILSPTKYSEKKTEFSSQDPGFSTSLENVHFQEVSGRPPDASHRQTNWEKVDPQAGQTQNKARYYLTSDLANFVNIGGSVSYAEAKTLAQALVAAKSELQVADMQAYQCTKTVTWFYPQIRDGDPVKVGGDRYSGMGTWCVTGAKWTLEYCENSSYTGGKPIVLCSGTELNLGLLRDRTVNYSYTLSPAAQSGQGQVTTQTTGGNYSLGGAFPISQNRRKF